MENNIDVSSVQNEMLLVGCFYTDPSLYIKYGKSIKSKYDFSDEVMRFFYNCFEEMYKTFTQTFEETKVNIFMSQNEENLKSYRQYGGYKTLLNLMKMADVNDVQSYYNTIKKYSVLREYKNKGHNVLKIMEHPRFNLLKASDVCKIVRASADRVQTTILDDQSAIPLSGGMVKSIKNWLIKPQMGLELPFKILNELFRGLRLGKLYALGFLSNDGKTRLATYLAAFVAFVNREKILFFVNETSEDDIRSCLITTVINNPCFSRLHGINIGKVEREIVLGIYKDDKGNLINRKMDDWGNFIEDEEEYINRVYNNSQAFRNVIAVGEWIDNQTQDTIFFERLKDYSDENLEFKIREAYVSKGIKYFIYDTLKAYKDEQWNILKQTTTMLSELMGELNACMWVDIQLSDDSIYADIFSFSSQNIANAKQLKHVLDHLILGKRLLKDEYRKYKIVLNDTSWTADNTPQEVDLNEKKTYYGFKIDKNRSGNKDKIPVLEVDLDKNYWKELGYLIKA